jgi:hypothetical protein
MLAGPSLSILTCISLPIEAAGYLLMSLIITHKPKSPRDGSQKGGISLTKERGEEKTERKKAREEQVWRTGPRVN